jgi:DMSO reductase anchor subunit
VNPAGSVLLLSTLTGFGYGLLAWLGVFAAGGWLPAGRWFGPVGVAVALAFASAGLAASMLHLGRPERAWRAFSQWRSSWLSREGVASLLTYPPALLFAWGWFYGGQDWMFTKAVGLLAGALGLATVGCTAMIYATLKPIRQWHNAHTAPDYFVFALFSGVALLMLLMAGWGANLGGAARVMVGGAIVAAVAKLAYWRFIDRQEPLATLASATGLSAFGTVRPLDQPHFTENYILREMGYRVARKHAAKLRRVVMVVAFAVPGVLAVAAGLGWGKLAASGLGVLSVLVGLLVERWLFFAEATHVSAVYYGR